MKLKFMILFSTACPETLGEKPLETIEEAEEQYGQESDLHISTSTPFKVRYRYSVTKIERRPSRMVKMT